MRGMWYLWGEEKYTQGFVWENLKDLADVGVGGRIILG
jgi:hypothetical protein